METMVVSEQYSKLEIGRSKEVVYQDILNTERETENIRAKGENIYNGFSKETQNEVDGIISNILEDEKGSWKERDKKTEELLTDYANKPEIVEVVNLFLTDWKMEDKVEALKKEFVPFKAAELDVSINQLSNQIDFDKMVDYFDDFKRDGSEKETISFGEVLFLGEMTNKAVEGKLKDESFSSLNRIEGNLTMFKDKCHRLGVLKENQANEEKVKDENLTKDNLLKEADRINKDLVDAYTLSWTYKKKTAFTNTNNMRDIIRMLDYTYYNYNDSSIDNLQYDPRLLRAIEKK
jgi:hypothetical protein